VTGRADDAREVKKHECDHDKDDDHDEQHRRATATVGRRIVLRESWHQDSQRVAGMRML